MKILHINEHLARKGGVETYLLALLPMLNDRGITSHVLYGEGEPTLWPASTAVPAIGRADLRRERRVEEDVGAVLARERPDVVHVHNVQNLGVLRSCWKYGSTVLTAHDYRTVCPANSFFYKRTQEVCGRAGAGPACFAAALTKRCLTPRPHYAAYFYHRSRESTARAGELARVIAPSTGARDFLIHAGIAPELIDVLPYFCPLEPRDEPRPLPPRTTITFMGRIAPNKGHEFFVEALGLLPNEVQGVMVGNFQGDAETHIRGLAERYGCADRITLRQWASREEVLRILDDTTVFIFPSLWPETLGIVGLEAMSRGVPVVASDIGGVREWLEHGRNGRLVEPKSGRQICEAVLDLTMNSDRLLSTGRCGIETVRRRFLPAQHVDALIQIYEHAIN